MKILWGSWLWLFLLPASVISADDAGTKRWELIAVGDMMLGRGVARKMEECGPDYPLARIRLMTDSCQLLAGNLESVISSAELTSQSPYRFKAHPLAAGRLLKQNGFGFLSVANNHAYDCGSTGLDESLKILDSLNIPYSGILARPLDRKPDSGLGSSGPEMVCRPAFMNVDRIRIGFLAFCQPYLLYPDSAGSIIAPADSATIVRSILAIKDSCRVVIASFHWGYEYHQRPSRAQRRLARLAIRSGARIVLGHHPHVLQGLEYYRDGVIAYSLGNFIFDQRDPLANQSAVLHLVMKGTAVDSVWLQPITITGKRPAEMDAGQAEGFRTLVDSLNQWTGTRSRKAGARIYLLK